MLIATRFLRLALDAAGGSMRVSPWRPQSSARGSWPLWSGMEEGDPSRGHEVSTRRKVYQSLEFKGRHLRLNCTYNNQVTSTEGRRVKRPLRVVARFSRRCVLLPGSGATSHRRDRTGVVELGLRRCCHEC